MTQAQNMASLPFFGGSLIITGDMQTIESITFSKKQVAEAKGFGEVYKGYVQLKEFLARQRTTFDLHVQLKGTPFQQAIYNTLMNVPFHESVSYQQLGELAGYPKAARAVGQAVSKNSLLVVVPCHRVLAKHQKLGGFSGGIDLKRSLLDLEEIPYKQ